MRTHSIYLILFLFLLSCTEKISGFEHLKLNFYLNKADSTIVYEGYSEVAEKVFHPAPEKLDLKSAVDYGEYLIDNNFIFVWYGTSDGNILIELENVDRETFLVIDNSIYSKDKNHIYDTRHGIIEEADVMTFEVVKTRIDGKIIRLGKDKDHYFFWDEIMTDTTGFGKAY